MSLSEIERCAYLQAMGIPVWVLRDSSQALQQPQAQEITSPVDDPERDVPESDITNKEISDLTSKSTEQLAGVDWPALVKTVESCTECGLSATRTQTVFGVGNQKADWLFIGEAPGADEDKQGKPFVGRAGQLLNAILFALGLQRDDVYIANVLKCRPPNNRDPRPEEVSECELYLRAQIKLIKPKVIIALGRHAAHNLLKTDKTLASLRGQQHDYHGTPLIVTYHPAYLLRTPSDKNKTWQDLCLANKLVKQ